VANINNGPQPLTKASFRPVESAAPPHDAHQGAKKTQNHQRYVTPVKLEFNIPSSQNEFNLNKEAHQEVLQLSMKDKYPTLEIVPSKEGKKQFPDLL
jgi:hypothetical protein